MSRKSVLVTGSTSGIGFAVASAFAARGSSVVLTGFGDPAKIEETRRALADTTGVQVAYIGADLQRTEEIESLIASAAEFLGGIDILVNNAGIQFTSPIEQFPPERWDAMIAVNLSAAFHTTRLVLGGMRARHWGRIINIASAHGLVASVNKAGYVAAKHGLVGLTKVIALEAAGAGITCNAICPGWVRTELVEQQIRARATDEGIALEQAALGLLTEKQPSGAFVTPEQIAATALFLCSDDAAQITGTALSMDGGWTAQ